MAKINLLPWREDRRQLRKREFMAMLGGVVIASVVAVFLAMQFFDQQMQRQRDRNAFLDAEIKLLDDKIVKIKDLEEQRDRLLQRQKIIEDLQANRSTTVHLLDELVSAIPDGVYLTVLKQTGTRLELQGRAQSHARISQFMENLDDSPWLKYRDLQIIQRGDPAVGANTNRSVALASIRQNFTVLVDLTNPNAPVDEAATANLPISAQGGQ
jgi:type IV pilus assembly protein PilN